MILRSHVNYSLRLATRSGTLVNFVPIVVVLRRIAAVVLSLRWPWVLIATATAIRRKSLPSRWLSGSYRFEPIR
jgi:hypothetical protein